MDLEQDLGGFSEEHFKSFEDKAEGILERTGYGKDNGKDSGGLEASDKERAKRSLLTLDSKGCARSLSLPMNSSV